MAGTSSPHELIVTATRPLNSEHQNDDLTAVAGCSTVTFFSRMVWRTWHQQQNDTETNEASSSSFRFDAEYERRRARRARVVQADEQINAFLDMHAQSWRKANATKKRKQRHERKRWIVHAVRDGCLSGRLARSDRKKVMLLPSVARGVSSADVQRRPVASSRRVSFCFDLGVLS